MQIQAALALTPLGFLSSSKPDPASLGLLIRHRQTGTLLRCAILMRCLKTRHQHQGKKMPSPEQGRASVFPQWESLQGPSCTFPASYLATTCADGLVRQNIQVAAFGLLCGTSASWLWLCSPFNCAALTCKHPGQECYTNAGQRKICAEALGFLGNRSYCLSWTLKFQTCSVYAPAPGNSSSPYLEAAPRKVWAVVCRPKVLLHCAMSLSSEAALAIEQAPCCSFETMRPLPLLCLSGFPENLLFLALPCGSGCWDQCMEVAQRTRVRRHGCWSRLPRDLWAKNRKQDAACPGVTAGKHNTCLAHEHWYTGSVCSKGEVEPGGSRET